MALKKQIGFQQNPQVTNKSDMNQKDSFMREKHAKGVLNYRHFQGKKLFRNLSRSELVLETQS